MSVQIFIDHVYCVVKEKFAMKLDHRAEVFMNLNGAQGEI